MNKRDSELLDKILQILTVNFRDPYLPRQFYREKEILNVYSVDEVDNVLKTYGHEYYDIVNLGEFIRIKPKYKDIIESYGSLSEYLISLNQKKTKAKYKTNSIAIIPLVTAGLALIASIYFGISNNSKGDTIKKLEIEIVKKDSIIRQFNDKK